MKGIIDIEYETLKEAVKAIEAKKGICEALPSARFSWKHDRMVVGHLQVGNHMPSLGGPDECSGIKFELIVCDQLGGRSTGTSAKGCRNCKPLKRCPLYPDSVATKIWDYQGATCYLTRHEEMGHYCGYVRFRRNPFGRGTGVHYDGFRNYIPVHGGITYAKKDSKGYVYGFDCARAGDDERPELKDLERLTKHTEKFCNMLLLAKNYELRYNRLRSKKRKAKIIDEYREKVGVSEDLGFGDMLNLLCGDI